MAKKDRRNEQPPREYSLEDLVRAFGPQALNNAAFSQAIIDMWKLEVTTANLDELDYIDMQVDEMVEFPEAEYIWARIQDNVKNM